MSRFRKFFLNMAKDIKGHFVALIALAAYFAVTHLIFGTICPIASVSGFPCPGCGLTRAFALLFTGHFVEAINMHACILLWVPLIIWMGLRRWLFEKKDFPVLPVVAVVLITLGYYVWRMVTLYPYQTPLVFREKNLFNMVIRAVINAGNHDL